MNYLETLVSRLPQTSPTEIRKNLALYTPGYNSPRLHSLAISHEFQPTDESLETAKGLWIIYQRDPNHATLARYLTLNGKDAKETSVLRVSEQPFSPKEFIHDLTAFTNFIETPDYRSAVLSKKGRIFIYTCSTGLGLLLSAIDYSTIKSTGGYSNYGTFLGCGFGVLIGETVLKKFWGRKEKSSGRQILHPEQYALGSSTISLLASVSQFHNR